MQDLVLHKMNSILLKAIYLNIRFYICFLFRDDSFTLIDFPMQHNRRQHNYIVFTVDMFAMSISIVSAMISTENTHLNHKRTMSIFPDAHIPSTSEYNHIIREVILTGGHYKFQDISMSGECFRAMDLHTDSAEFMPTCFLFFSISDRIR